MLDVECFTYLNRALESPLSPVVVVATNRGVCTIRGTDVLSSHGVPVDLLDRMLIVRTQQYSKEEIREVRNPLGSTTSVASLIKRVCVLMGPHKCDLQRP